MKARMRRKLRRRDDSSPRDNHNAGGYGRSRLAREARARSSAPMTSLEARTIELKTMIRLDGDSIAYFWALEAESAISYAILAAQWRKFGAALRGSKSTR